MWLWALAWALCPIQKMDVYHWLYEPTITPQNLAFRLLGRKGGFWYPRLIPPYSFASLGRITTIRVYSPETRPWRFSDQSVPSFNFGNSFVSHVQWLDKNPTVGRLSWNTRGRTPAHNFCITINNLSNQFLFTLNDCAILEPVHWTCYFLFLSHSSAHVQVQKPYPMTISHTCKSSWTLFNFYSYLAKFSL